MSWSFGETRALAVKSARGAGLPWGLAEEAGYAVDWLERRNAPGVAAMAFYLEGVSDSNTYDADTCPIAFGAHLSDIGEWQSHFPRSVYQPLLLVPFLSMVAGQATLELAWAEDHIVLNSNEIGGRVENRLASTGLVECTVRDSVVMSLADLEASRVPDDRQPFIDVLTRFARKTYAPATEASRLKGAGAGLDDND